VYVAPSLDLYLWLSHLLVLCYKYVHTLQKPKAAPAPAPVTKASQADEEDYEQQVLLKMMQAHNKAAS
jgi:hypothetical protein